MKLNKSTLKTLLESPGISGREEVLTKVVVKAIKKNGLELIQDNLGSVWGVKKSTNKNAKKVLIDAHMDEVGFMVTGINKSGTLKFEKIGGIWNAPLNYQRVKVWNDSFDKSTVGVISWPNTNSHKGIGAKAPEVEDMLIDLGFSSEKEVEKAGIKVGATVTFDSETIFNGNRVISKAIDNRLGVCAVIELMNFIKEKEFDFDIYIGSSVQEEVGLRGAKTSAHMIEPDLAIVIDVSPATDVAGGSEPKGVLGKGTMIRHKDAIVVYNRNVIEYLRGLAKKNDIKTQDYISLGGTNAGIIEIVRSGVTVVPIGLVARNLHTASSVFDITDYEETLKLLESILNDLDSKKIVKFK